MRLHPALIAALATVTLVTGVQAQTLDKVKSSGTITLAYRESSIPFSYLGGDGQPVGFAWEICNKIVDQVKKATGRNDLKIATQSVTSQNRIPLLSNGTIDIECGSTTNNSERAKQVAFATNYFYTGTRLLVKTGSPVKSVADLKGKKVVSTTGTTNFQILRKLNADQNLNFELIGAKDHAESALLVSKAAPTPSAWTTSCCTAFAPAHRTRPSWPWWASRFRSSPTPSCCARTTPASRNWWTTPWPR